MYKSTIMRTTPMCLGFPYSISAWPDDDAWYDEDGDWEKDPDEEEFVHFDGFYAYGSIAISGLGKVVAIMDSNVFDNSDADGDGTRAFYEYDNNVLGLNIANWLVYPALEITTTSLPEGKVGDAYSATLEATGGKPSYTWSATGLPKGLTCLEMGVIFGIPTEAGDFTVTVTVTDDLDNSDSAELSLKVYPALEITTTSLPEGKVGDAYEATLETTRGKEPCSWSISEAELPPGLSLDASTGEISGTPDEAGEFTFTVQVEDSFSPPNTDSKELALKIYSRVYLPLVLKE